MNSDAEEARPHSLISLHQSCHCRYLRDIIGLRPIDNEQLRGIDNLPQLRLDICTPDSGDASCRDIITHSNPKSDAPTSPNGNDSTSTVLERAAPTSSQTPLHRMETGWMRGDEKRSTLLDKVVGRGINYSVHYFQPIGARCLATAIGQQRVLYASRDAFASDLTGILRRDAGLDGCPPPYEHFHLHNVVFLNAGKELAWTGLPQGWDQERSLRGCVVSTQSCEDSSSSSYYMFLSCQNMIWPRHANAECFYVDRTVHGIRARLHSRRTMPYESLDSQEKESLRDSIRLGISSFIYGGCESGKSALKIAGYDTRPQCLADTQFAPMSVARTHFGLLAIMSRLVKLIGQLLSRSGSMVMDASAVALI
ncbi:hypothetical protein ACRALDRAFT_208924 [Sodiomyces alcalophilus JCM 7366]|uniref:uncharacterized protein n=1 Tax=Sodiomyces alcalophilus JCM 7366 TaxID=591952 RepID=UPI0039B456EF